MEKYEGKGKPDTEEALLSLSDIETLFASIRVQYFNDLATNVERICESSFDSEKCSKTTGQTIKDISYVLENKISEEEKNLGVFELLAKIKLLLIKFKEDLDSGKLFSFDSSMNIFHDRRGLYINELRKMSESVMSQIVIAARKKRVMQLYKRAKPSKETIKDITNDLRKLNKECPDDDPNPPSAPTKYLFRS
ncbi:unnamed protein product [Moneuplotes crassus]|uniref:Uncharacterized protein n=1 Tax=Euplotes crassus TaxID=5936 RepID=A0AAD1XYK5_EUPCR|nr:unnamed protein product [Moneuplotes crassus]